MVGNLKCSYKDEESWAIIEVKGRVDIHTAPGLKELMWRLLKRGKKRIVINMRSVEHIDPVGLAALIVGAKRLREHRGRLVVSSPSSKVKGVLQPLASGEILSVCKDERQARATI